jgi:Domain of unknown function (DUF1929)/Glyoxal oxidase N-terminus/Abnormal spindle-like microcephaly-assoc'd, ASPM-SPD-2-Hydin
MSNGSIGNCVLQAQTLGLAGTHVAILPNGRVLFFSHDQFNDFDVNRGFWQLWDPSTGPLPLQQFNRNLFCSGLCFLPDGRLLVAAGQAWNWFPFTGTGADHDVHVFDPTSESWARFQDMPSAHWYPTCVTLTDGNALIAMGDAIRYPVPTDNDDYHIFDWRANTLSQPKRFNTDPPFIYGPYPFIKLLPDGSAGGILFVYYNSEARLFSSGTSTWNPSRFLTLSKRSRTYPHEGSCVILPLHPDQPDVIRVLVVGGQGPDGTQAATETAEIFEFNRSSPENSFWRSPSGGNMIHRRFMSDAVLLPDGTVLIVNGAAAGQKDCSADLSSDPVMNAELFDPATETFRDLAPINHPRLYHSAAILLPDARVLISGNTKCFNPSNPVEDNTVDIFSPPYLFRGPRPEITSAPAEIFCEREYEVVTPNAIDIASVALLRLGCTTHTNNMDQRYVGQSIVQRETDRLTVAGPYDRATAPPGFYMLFLVNRVGVPSVAKMIHLDVPSGPSIGLDPTRVDFGQVAIRGYGLAVLKVSNLGTAGLTIQSVSASPAGGPFSVDSPPTALLAPGDHVLFTVTFRPRGLAADMGQLNITSDDPTSPAAIVPLEGSGVVMPPTIFVLPTNLSFGKVAVGDHRALAFTIRNVGSSPLVISSVSPPSDPAFTVLGRPSTIDCFQDAPLTVSFAPTKVRLYPASIIVTSNDPNHPSIVLSMGGRGIGAGVMLMPASPDICDDLDAELASLQVQLQGAQGPAKTQIMQRIAQTLGEKKRLGCP